MVWDAIKSGAEAVGDFVTGGGGDAVSTASNAGEAMAQAQIGGSSNWAADAFSSAANFAGDAFNWIGDNHEAANVIGGVAMGVGSAYSASKDRQMQRDLQRERLEAEKIAPGEVGSGYGSYRNNVTQGLISNGMLANDRGNG